MVITRSRLQDNPDKGESPVRSRAVSRAGLGKEKEGPSVAEVDPNYPGEAAEVVEKLSERLHRIEAENHDMARVIRDIYRRLPPVPEEEVHDSSKVSRTPVLGKKTTAEAADQTRRPERKSVLERLGYHGQELPKPKLQPREAARTQGHRSHHDEFSDDKPIDARDVQEIVKAELSHRRLNNPELNRERARQALREENTSPFIPEIAEAPAPRKFSQPSFKLFDGKTDPTNHLRHYKQNMTFWTHDEATMCRVFPTSLGDRPLRWFTNLPQGQVESFAELAELFVARFITNRPGPKEIGSLYSIQRRKEESLRVYLNRYFDLCQEVRGCTERTKIDAFKHGLSTEHPLYDNLVLNPPASVHDLTARVENYATLEETKKLRLPSVVTDGRKKDSSPRREKDSDRPRGGDRNRNRERQKREDRRRDTDRREKTSFPDKGAGGSRGSKRPAEEKRVDETNTIFSMSLPRVLEKIKGEKYLRWPKPMGGERSARRQDVFCDFHNDVGHRTRDCITLRNHLEELVRRGYLAEFITKAKDNAEERRPEKKRAEHGSGSYDTVDVIHGVVHKSEATKKVMRSVVHRAMLIENALSTSPEEDPVTVTPYKKGETPTLSFSDADLAGLEIPHNDALVIRARIDVRNVKRILIDAGSSTDIIYMNLYQNLPGIKLKPVEHPVFSFSGQPIWPLGMCTLNVRLGPVSTPVDFLVIGVEAPYNAILGRSWLGAMKAVASSYHQKVKFPSPQGIVTVKSSQSAARACFQNAVQTTLSEKRPEKKEALDADTQLALAVSANNNNKGIVIKEGGLADVTPKRKAEELDPLAKNKQKVGE